MSSSQLVAQLGDFAAEVLVALVRGFQPANQGSGRGTLPGRHRDGGRPAVVVSEPLDGRADLGLGVEPGAADACGRGDVGVRNRLAGCLRGAQDPAGPADGILVSPQWPFGSAVRARWAHSTSVGSRPVARAACKCPPDWSDNGSDHQVAHRVRPTPSADKPMIQVNTQLPLGLSRGPYQADTPHWTDRRTQASRSACGFRRSDSPTSRWSFRWCVGAGGDSAVIGR